MGRSKILLDPETTFLPGPGQARVVDQGVSSQAGEAPIHVGHARKGGWCQHKAGCHEGPFPQELFWAVAGGATAGDLLASTGGPTVGH